MNHIEKALTDGLIAGYAGGKPKGVERAGFNGKVSDISFENGNYHDEWFVDSQKGGGQELVEVEGQKFTRLYAGGVPDEEVLQNLGITHDKVGEYLKKKIMELGISTRLFEDCMPEPDGQWQYRYVVTSSDMEIELTTGMETIDYSGVRVHAHAFILSPIK